MPFPFLTFFFLPGFLRCHVSKEVKRGLGHWWGGTYTSCITSRAASSTTFSVGFCFGSFVTRVLLGAQLSFQRQLVAVV